MICNWCGDEIEDPDGMIPIGTDADGNDLYWCGNCEEGRSDPTCVGGEYGDDEDYSQFHAKSRKNEIISSSASEKGSK
jgi:hypothetical protein